MTTATINLQTPPSVNQTYIFKKAFSRYLSIKNIPKSQQSLEDKMFLENFDAAIRFWGLSSQGDILVTPEGDRS